MSQHKKCRLEEGDSVTFDEIFDHIGHFGLVQVLIYMFVGAPMILCGTQNIASSFLTAEMPHWCQEVHLENFSYTQQREISIPYDSDYDPSEDDYDDKFVSCDIFHLPWENYSDEYLVEWDRQEMTDEANSVECNEGWVYKRDDFFSTIITEWNLVCEDGWVVPLGTTLYMSGIFFGSLCAGFLSDHFGRRTAFTLCNTIHCLSGIAAAFAPNIILYIICRFIVSVAVNGTVVVGIVICTELIGPRHRTWATLLYMVYFAMGYIVLAAVAVIVRDHQKLQIVIASPVLILIFLHFLLPESPRWLLTQGRHEEALKVLKLMATVNGKPLPGTLHVNLYGDDIITEIGTADNEKTINENRNGGDDCKSTDGNASTSHTAGEMGITDGSILDLLRYPFLRKATLVFLLSWFTAALSYYGVSINLAELTGDIFVNTFVAGGTEVLADLATVPLVSHRKVGRCRTVAGGLLLGGTGMVLSIPFLVFTSWNMEYLSTTFVMIGKFGVTIAYTSLFLYTTEVFPTPVRNLALGGCSMVSGMGTTIAPYFGGPLQNVWPGLSNLIIGAFALVAGCVTFLLPETLGSKIPDTIEEAEEMAKRKHL